MKSVFLVLAVLFSFVFQTHAAEQLTIVQNDKVCMVTDSYSAKEQIPTQHNGKTYYGCCPMCKKKLETDATTRTAKDPVTGETVDKATAVIAAKKDNSVLYFANKKNFEKYSKTAAN